MPATKSWNFRRSEKHAIQKIFHGDFTALRILNKLGTDGIEQRLYDAPVDHCLSFEQVSDEISDFQSDVYYQNPSYLECSYRAGYLLD